MENSTVFILVIIIIIILTYVVLFDTYLIDNKIIPMDTAIQILKIRISILGPIVLWSYWQQEQVKQIA